jgi:hypothetical protein
MLFETPWTFAMHLTWHFNLQIIALVVTEAVRAVDCVVLRIVIVFDV